jgi:hypothetical protein
MGIRRKHDVVRGDDDDGPSEILNALEENGAFPEDEAPPHDVMSLLEQNARLRAVAVKLSRLVGDLPKQEWVEASAPKPRGS